MPRLPDEVCSADGAELVRARPLFSGGCGSELTTGQQLNYGDGSRLLTASSSQTYSRWAPVPCCTISSDIKNVCNSSGRVGIENGWLWISARENEQLKLGWILRLHAADDFLHHQA